MEKLHFQQSLKCIPIPAQATYKKQLLGKAEQFLQRLRWRTFFYLNPDITVRQKETYGFNTYKTAPQSKELADFEKELADLIAGVKFTNFRSPFQQQLKKSVCEIKSSDYMLINADKTANIYKVSTDSYKKTSF